MTFVSQTSSQLQHALELLDPLLDAMRRQDHSALFLSLAPGLAEEAYGLVQQATTDLIRAGWAAGRRGRMTASLLKVLGRFQQARREPSWDRVIVHFSAASRQLRHTAAALSRCAAARP